MLRYSGDYAAEVSGVDSGNISSMGDDQIVEMVTVSRRTPKNNMCVTTYSESYYNKCFSVQAWK